MEEKKVTNGLQKQSDSVVKSLEEVFKNLPHLPENIREVLVKIAPWLALIIGALNVLFGLFGGLDMLAFLPLAMLGAPRAGMAAFLGVVFMVASGVLLLMAYPKLVKRSHAGWTYLFWSEALSAVYALVTVSLSSVVGVLIGLYILFEVKKYYK